MRKKYFIYILVILLSAFLLTGCTKEAEEVVTEDEDATVVEEDVVEEEEEEEQDEDMGELTNPEDFTKVKQTLGESSEFEYSVVEITESKEEGYHDFQIEMSSTQEGALMPLIAVEPVLEKGIIRITLKNIYGDSTGLTHTSSLPVDLGAITALYRTVTSLENTRIYDIGILANNPFKLDLVEEGDLSWIYSVKVAYDTEYVAPNIDFGSTEFSSDAQEIEGVTSSESAKITTYSYSVSGGVLKFVLAVSSGASNPIPSVSAQYDEGGMLEVTFPSLTSDKVSTWGSTISLPSGVVAYVSRSGESSLYEYGGISGKKPFKLSATQAPNQVIVEIQL